ncbi:MAG: DegV family protein [Chloroflexota bacterium]|nr:DegV family protein [Chloroflexota bacterium]
MTSYAIITDTDASLPLGVAEKYNIRQVPITVHFGDEVLKTNEEINDTQLFDRVDHEGVLPTTSAPSPGAFAEAYMEAFESGADTILCFTVSSEVSATYGAAFAAKEMHPDRDITVLDTRTLSMGQGFVVLAAAEAAREGASKEEIIAIAEDVRDRSHLFAALSTLKYLAMSGRVGHLAAGMANLLNVKPILSVRDGKLDLLERVRTQRKSWARVIELVQETSADHTFEQLAIVHVRAPDDARQFQQQLCSQIACPGDVMTAELTPGLSVHSGAGLVGAAFVVEK